MTVSAVARLMPKPPALVESKKQNWQAPGAGNREGGERMCERKINRNTCKFSVVNFTTSVHKKYQRNICYKVNRLILNHIVLKKLV